MAIFDITSRAGLAIPRSRKWRLNRIPRSISRNGAMRAGRPRRRQVFTARNFIEQFFARGRSRRGRNRQGNVWRMWRDMASGAAQFAELVWRVLPRNRSQLTRRSRPFFRGANACAPSVVASRVNNPSACVPDAVVSLSVSSTAHIHHGTTGSEIAEQSSEWLSQLMIILHLEYFTD